MRIRNALKIVIFLTVVLLISIIFGIILKNKREIEISIVNYHDEHEGLYVLPEDTVDVLYIGSSHAYSSISPEDIFKDYGITGYVQGSSLQRIWQSYYYLEEFLYTQHPKVVILDAFTLPECGPNSEPNDREAIDKMKFSPAKIKAAWTVNMINPQEESFISYLFPMLRYHDRFTDLKKQDFVYLTTSSEALAKGFVIRRGVVPTKFNYEDYIEKECDYENINNLGNKYLKKIKQLCDKNDIPLIMVKYPTCLWNQAKYLEVKQWTDENGIPYFDFNAQEELRGEVDIDWEKDCLDGGNHLNYEGALKMSVWMGKWLKENFEFEDKREDIKYDQWNKDYILYKRYVNNSEVKNITDFREYIEKITDDGYVVCLASSSIQNDTIEGYLKHKLTYANHTNDAKFANLVVMYGSDCIYNEIDENIVKYDGIIEGLELSISSERDIIANKNIERLVNNKEIYEVDSRELNVIIFDTMTKSYVDKSVWQVRDNEIIRIK